MSYNDGVPAIKKRGFSFPRKDGLIRCYSCKIYKTYENFLPSDIKLFNTTNKTSYRCRQCGRNYIKLHMREYRIAALSKIAYAKNTDVKCCECDVSNVPMLQIAHTDTTRGCFVYNTAGGNLSFYIGVIRGEIKTDNLAIKCANHNILDEYTHGFRIENSYGFLNHKKMLESLSSRKEISMSCQKCGVTDIRLLTKEHIEGSGHDDMRKFGSNHKLDKAIVDATRDVNDLTILCYNCQQLNRGS